MFDENFLKAIKLGYIGSVLYTVETVVGRTRVQVPLSQQNNNKYEKSFILDIISILCNRNARFGNILYCWTLLRKTYGFFIREVL